MAAGRRGHHAEGANSISLLGGIITRTGVYSRMRRLLVDVIFSPPFLHSGAARENESCVDEEFSSGVDFDNRSNSFDRVRTCKICTWRGGFTVGVDRLEFPTD